MNYAIRIWPMQLKEHGRCYYCRIMWKLTSSVVATAVTTTIVTATTVTADSENVKWRDLNRYYRIMEKREYERGTVVLSYS